MGCHSLGEEELTEYHRPVREVVLASLCLVAAQDLMISQS